MTTGNEKAARPRTEKEENLDEIIDDTSEAKYHLERARQTAKVSGDNDGAKELEEAANVVEKIKDKYAKIRDKKTG
jgi:LPS sulfotransferase NodH